MAVNGEVWETEVWETEVWETRARWWADCFAGGDDPEYREQIIPLVQMHTSGAQRLLDVGCGEGQLARASGVAAVGVDRSGAMCRVAAERGSIVVRSDAGALPFVESSFDAALACLVLEHVSDPSAIAFELARVLKSGGRFLLFLNHPFMQTPESGWIEDHILEENYWRVGPYLRETVVEEEVEPGVKIPFAHRPLSFYVNTFAAFGLYVTQMVEPVPPAQYIADSGEHSGAADIPRLLFLRFEKT